MDLNNTEKIRLDILTRIMKKGGLYGSCANLYFNDSYKSHLFILEISEQCHHQSLVDFFDNELIDDIMNYRIESKESALHVL